MKHGLLLLLFLFVRNAFALYGAKVEHATESYVVSLMNNGKYFCSGVLISPTKILTAGHCIDLQGQEEYGNSHGLVYAPENLVVKSGDISNRASSITLSPKYFEGTGFEAEDLALIEVRTPFKNIRPISFARKSDLVNKATISLIARNKKVSGALSFSRSYAEATVLFIDSSSGACLGDSGGAVVINKNGEPKLAGILMYSGEETCVRKTSFSYFPKAQF